MNRHLLGQQVCEHQKSLVFLVKDELGALQADVAERKNGSLGEQSKISRVVALLIIKATLTAWVDYRPFQDGTLGST